MSAELSAWQVRTERVPEAEYTGAVSDNGETYESVSALRAACAREDVPVPAEVWSADFTQVVVLEAAL